MIYSIQYIYSIKLSQSNSYCLENSIDIPYSLKNECNPNLSQIGVQQRSNEDDAIHYSRNVSRTTTFERSHYKAFEKCGFPIDGREIYPLRFLHEKRGFWTLLELLGLLMDCAVTIFVLYCLMTVSFPVKEHLWDFIPSMYYSSYGIFDCLDFDRIFVSYFQNCKGLVL